MKRCEICGFSFKNETTSNQGKMSNNAIHWEYIAEFGLVRGLFKTVSQCLFQPSCFFSKINEKSSALSAWLFAVVIGSIAITFELLWQQGSFSFFNSLFNVTSDRSVDLAKLVFLPMVLSVNIYLLSFYVHFLLILSKGKRQTFSATFIAICYMQSATIFNLIPYFGSLVSFIWMFSLLIIGISQVHTLSRIRTAITIFFPFLIFIAFFVFLLLSVFSSAIIVNALFKDVIPMFR
jgi:hypothetical protein